MNITHGVVFNILYQQDHDREYSSTHKPRQDAEVRGAPPLCCCCPRAPTASNKRAPPLQYQARTISDMKRVKSHLCERQQRTNAPNAVRQCGRVCYYGTSSGCERCTNTTTSHTQFTPFLQLVRRRCRTTLRCGRFVRCVSSACKRISSAVCAERCAINRDLSGQPTTTTSTNAPRRRRRSHDMR